MLPPWEKRQRGVRKEKKRMTERLGQAREPDLSRGCLGLGLSFFLKENIFLGFKNGISTVHYITARLFIKQLLG